MGSKPRRSNKLNCIEDRIKNVTRGCPRISTLKKGSDYDNFGANGGEKIMERSVRTDRAPGSWRHQTSKQ